MEAIDRLQIGLESNTRDIASVSRDVARIMAVIEAQGEKIVDMTLTLKDCIMSIRGVTDGLNKAVSLQSDVTNIKENFSRVAMEYKAKLEAHDHSLGNLKNANLILPDLKDRIVANSNEIKNLNEKSNAFLSQEIIEAKMAKGDAKYSELEKRVQSLESIRNQAIGGMITAKGGIGILRWFIALLVGGGLATLLQMAVSPRKTEVTGKIYTEQKSDKLSAGATDHELDNGK